VDRTTWVSSEEIEMAQDDHDYQASRAAVARAPGNHRLRGTLATALLLCAGALVTSGPAFAVFDGGAEHSDSWNGDHDGIYQVQRGDLICESREACGGAAAIPMNRPGYWYLPGGMFQAYHPPVPPVWGQPAHRRHRG
jgi:hypothetical protein